MLVSLMILYTLEVATVLTQATIMLKTTAFRLKGNLKLKFFYSTYPEFKVYGNKEYNKDKRERKEDDNDG